MCLEPDLLTASNLPCALQDIDHFRYVLTEEGTGYLASGTPEAQVFHAVPADGLPLAELAVRDEGRGRVNTGICNVHVLHTDPAEGLPLTELALCRRQRGNGCGGPLATRRSTCQPATHSLDRGTPI